MERFGLSQVQAQAILDMQLRRLAALERQKIEDEYQEIMARIAYFEDLLAHPGKLRAIIRDDILMLKEKFGDGRRTLIAYEANGELNEEDLIANDNMLISYSAGAYIKRMKAETFRAQGRGGRGIKGMATRDEDEVINLLFARNLDSILLFTNKGRVYCSKVYELPEGSRTARGAHIANFLSLQHDETVSTMVIVPDFEQSEYITLITRQARIKRMELSAFSNVRSSGLIAMNLDPEDSLDWARLTNGNEEFIIVTRNGKALRFHEDHVRSMGRTAAGVMAMRLLDGDEIVSMDVVKHDHDLFVIHERGWGKRVPLEEYNAKGRYTQGMWTTDHNRLAEIGAIVAARVVHPQDEVTIMTSQGIVLRTEVRGISQMGRATRGVRIVKMPEVDAVAAIAVITYADLTRGVDGTDPTGPTITKALEETTTNGAILEVDALDLEDGDEVDEGEATSPLADEAETISTPTT